MTAVARAVHVGGRGGDASPPDVALPPAAQLAALGPVLCAHRASEAPLLGWMRATRAVAACGIDSDGLQEALLFFDAEGRCCWRLHLLPDSDFLAWDALCATLPALALVPDASGLGDSLWQRLAGRLRGARWRCSALRLHAVAVPGAPRALALSGGTLTPTGLNAAQRIARLLDAEDAALRDDCCCLRAARAAAPPQATPPSDASPIIRFDTRHRP